MAGRGWLARPRGGWSLLVWVLAALAIALSVVAGIVVAKARSATAAADARVQVLAAARGDATVILSYDYHHLAQDFATAERLMTPSFRKQYVQTTKVLQPTASQYHVTVTASVSAAGARDVTADQATVLLFVDQVSTNSRRSAPRTDQSRVRMLLVKTGGRWLVNRLDAL